MSFKKFLENFDSLEDILKSQYTEHTGAWMFGPLIEDFDIPKLRAAQEFCKPKRVLCVFILDEKDPQSWVCTRFLPAALPSYRFITSPKYDRKHPLYFYPTFDEYRLLIYYINNGIAFYNLYKRNS